MPNVQPTLLTGDVMEIRKAIRQLSDQIAALHSSLPSQSVAGVDPAFVVMLRADRLKDSPEAHEIGTACLEKDTSLVYVVEEVASSGVKRWIYSYGTLSGVFANRPAASSLAVNDTGLLYHSTDSLDYQWNGSAWVSLDGVRGGGSMVDANRIPKVSATPGQLAESAITDDGSALVSIAARNLVLDNNQAYEGHDSAGSARTLMLMGNENPDILHIRNGQRAIGGPIQFEGTAGAVKVAIDAIGNMNLATGVLQVAGTQVVGARLGAIGGPSGGTVIDAQARTVINAILIALHAHGLIG